MQSSNADAYVYAIELINIENRDVCFSLSYKFVLYSPLTENKNGIHIFPRSNFKFNSRF